MEIIDFGKILKAYGLTESDYTCQSFGKGNINSTFGLSKTNASEPTYILQKINTSIFTEPQKIAHNWRLASSFIQSENPAYQMIHFIQTIDHQDYYTDENAKVWRLTPFVPDSKTLEIVSSPEEAYLTAFMFGQFASSLSKADATQYQSVLPDFHNLMYRVKQFQESVKSASQNRLDESHDLLAQMSEFDSIVSEYDTIFKQNLLPLRIFHHDAKIGNILFSKTTGKPMGIIDFDTLMPGTVISDIGDMLRTLTSSASEDETDISRIDFREDFVAAILQAYRKAMADVLTAEESSKLYFAGLVLVYMQAIRFLADFLNNDIYYQIRYPGHNLMRAKNQFQLLHLMMDKRSEIERKYL
jgi:thiamine kinase-like enzyme